MLQQQILQLQLHLKFTCKVHITSFPSELGCLAITAPLISNTFTHTQYSVTIKKQPLQADISNKNIVNLSINCKYGMDNMVIHCTIDFCTEQ